jgi:beta-glucosidase-like glycosyl hydrolase
LFDNWTPTSTTKWYCQHCSAIDIIFQGVNMSTAKEIKQRVEELLKQMTIDEKVSLLAGRDIWNTVPIQRLGIPSITMTDGPHGVRSTAPEAGRKMGAVTSFPTGIAMGAAWNPQLVEQVGQALGAPWTATSCWGRASTSSVTHAAGATSRPSRRIPT